ncbi:hypothetical protein AB8O64_09945 [Streptomyces sp. QH1-20]|uniref:hypothetical protein n=1 Tax=Streptomyces sp. QH1-20 TaxID=3240934 RepID=UPI00351783A6
MGWTVLYIAFGVVALWLLGEVLLQYKARLRWRLLAFVGFLGVVVGVLIPSVVVIGVGAIAFAIGQTYVTLSFRRGFSTGWAIRRGKADAADAGDGKESAGAEKTRAGRRRRGGGAAPLAEPTLEVSGLEVHPVPEADPGPALLPNAAHQPAPAASEETAPGPYGGYGDSTGYDQGQDTSVFGTYDPYGGQTPGAPTQGDQSGQGAYAGQFDYGQGQYAPYSDPYIGNRQQTYETYEGYGQQDAYAQQQYGTAAPAGYPLDAYGMPQQYDIDTPPGGVWVPQQRDTDTPPPPPGQQPPHPEQLPGHGYDGQPYRY